MGPGNYTFIDLYVINRETPFIYSVLALLVLVTGNGEISVSKYLRKKKQSKL